jgi:hypothetical protein
VTLSRGSANEHDNILEGFTRIICKIIFYRLHVLITLIVDDILYWYMLLKEQDAKYRDNRRKHILSFVLPSVTLNEINTSLKLLPLSPYNFTLKFKYGAIFNYFWLIMPNVLPFKNKVYFISIRRPTLNLEKLKVDSWDNPCIHTESRTTIRETLMWWKTVSFKSRVGIDTWNPNYSYIRCA